MYRYLILIWNPADAVATSTARALSSQLLVPSLRWSCVIDQPGMIGLHAGVRAGSSQARLMRDHGVVFGTLFTRDAESFSAAPPALDGTTEKVLSTRGRYLLTQFWGRYVAAFRDPDTQTVSVLRDPSGALPCFYTSHQNVWIVFSDVQDCVQLPAIRLTINWRYIEALVPFSALQSRQTALNEVTEIQQGECVTFGTGGPVAKFLWHPLEIARQDPIPSFERAVAELKRTVHACTHAWAGSYSGILHNLSGGLDSSLVLSCIRRAPANTPVTCLNYFASGRDQDEREYARLAANHLGAPLTEYPLEPDKVNLERVLAIKPSTRPWFYMYELEHGELEANLARDHRANAIFSGAGGDAVFFQARADLAVADFLHRHGYRPAVFPIALDAARIIKSSVWALLRKAVRERKQSWNPLQRLDHPQSLVPPEVDAAARSNEDLIHPWLRGDMQDVPPGVVWHIASMCIPTPFYDSFGNESAPERVFPLLSQPVVELCLRTPTWLTITGARDRSVARQAFRDELPPQIIKRRAKGAIDHHIRRVLDNNLEFVRGMLLEGLLVRERLLDRSRLELYLSRERSPADFEYNDIMQQHLCIEAWLRRWADIAARRAAA